MIQEAVKHAADDARRYAAYWLGLGLSHIRETVPISLTFAISNTKYWTAYGVRMNQAYTYIEQERAVTDGGKKAGAEYIRTRYLVLGRLPELFRRHQRMFVDGGPLEAKHCFRFPMDEGDWYVSHYYDGPDGPWGARWHTREELEKLHPFGPTWGFDRWNHEEPWMGAIAQYSARKMVRIPVQAEEVPIGLAH